MKRKRFLETALMMLLAIGLLAGLAVPTAQAAGSAEYTDFIFPRSIGGTAALRSDGTVAIWDQNSVFSDKELARIRSWTDIIQIMDAGDALLALRADGTVDAAVAEFPWGDFDRSEVGKWRNIRTLVCENGYHCFALGWDGKLYMTGKSNMINDQDRLDYSRWKDMKKFVAGVCPKSEYMLGLCWDGTVIDNRTYDSKMEGYDLPWSGETKNIVDIASDGWLDLALRADGTVLVRGSDREGYEESISKWKNVSSICFAGETAAALLSDGTVVFAQSFNEDSGESYQGVREMIPLEDLYGIILLFADGSVKALSSYSDDLGALGELNSWKNITRVWAGTEMAAGLQSNGNILTLGFDLNDLQ